jgi:hypothetical protein
MRRDWFQLVWACLTSMTFVNGTCDALSGAGAVQRFTG